MVMSGVREMTLAEEIRNLAELGVDQNVIDSRRWNGVYKNYYPRY